MDMQVGALMALLEALLPFLPAQMAEIAAVVNRSGLQR
jgi:hypothetical protein